MTNYISASCLCLPSSHLWGAYYTVAERSKFPCHVLKSSRKQSLRLPDPQQQRCYGVGYPLLYNACGDAVYINASTLFAWLQDGVYQPFQDLLPYHDFSVRLPKSRLPHITEILTAIPDEEYVKLRQGVAKYWPAFVWHPKWGGQAYDYVIRSLAARANNHLAELY